jgi:acetyl-CoA C-acetyltransferase
MAREKAEALGCSVMATIGAQASYGIEMKYVLVAPIWAIPKVLARRRASGSPMSTFSRSTRPFPAPPGRHEGAELDPARTNVNGGSVALGHPIGASGCRVLVTLIHEMIRQDKKTGLASLCLGGGEAVALVVKR